MSSQENLPGFVADGLPRFFPEETLYSWCARYFQLSGMIDPSRVGKILFGHKDARYQHDFPVGVSHFNAATHGIHGTIDQILDSHTLLTYHRPFMSVEAVAQAKAAMQTGRLREVRQSFALGKSGWKVPAPLKTCPLCVKEELASNQVAHWHLDHQCPSAYICLRHQSLLRVLRDEGHFPPARGWWLPASIPASLWHPSLPLPDKEFAQLINLAEWTAALIDVSFPPLSAQILRYCYLCRAKDLGWLAFDGTLRFQKLKTHFWEKYAALSILPGFQFVQEAQVSHGGFIGLMLHRQSGARHPFKHLVMLCFLYRDIATFRQHYAELYKFFEEEGESAIEQRLRADQSTLHRLIADRSLSLTAAAKQIGITTTTARRFANQTAIHYKKRPRFFTPVLEQQLIALLNNGTKISTITATLSITPKYIRAYLAENLALREQYRELVRGQEFKDRRSHFLEVLNANAGVPIKRIRRIPGNGFEWLLRNDLEWLQQQLPGIWHR